jgi:hypothetical protein
LTPKIIGLSDDQVTLGMACITDPERVVPMDLMLGTPGSKPPLGGWLPPIGCTAAQTRTPANADAPGL